MPSIRTDEEAAVFIAQDATANSRTFSLSLVPGMQFLYEGQRPHAIICNEVLRFR
jgi:hypothetical protein